MLAGTHRMISHQIADILGKDGYDLDKKAISWGSIKPDFMLPPFRMKHYMNESLTDVVKMIDDSVSTDFDHMGKLSEHIGVITHYITDFFCLPHSERWEFIKSGRTIEHIVYEQRLQRIAKERSIIARDMEFNPCVERDSIEQWITNCHRNYQSQTDYMHDLEQALGMSLSVTRWILDNRKKIAA